MSKAALIKLFSCYWIACLSIFQAQSQDTHYWNTPFNAGGFFEPGATLANNGDSAVYFFNPALLSNITRKTISLNAELYQSQAIIIKDGAGTGLDLRSRNYSSVPLMIAGNLLVGKRRLSIAYALVHTPGINFSASQRRDDRFQVLADYYSPGPEYFIGQFLIENRSSETKAQAAVGFRLNRNWSAGFRLEGNLFSQFFNISYIGRALVNTGLVNFQVVSNDASYNVNYSRYGLRSVAGLAYDRGNDHIGVTVSTPLLRLGGSGIMVSDNVLQNFLLGGSLNPAGIVANTRQTGLKAIVKQPISLAFGYLHEFRRSQVYLALEYFGSISEYDILKPRDEFFIRPDTGSNNLFTYSLLRLKDSRKAVLNAAAGGRFPLKKGINGYIALRTDFSYLDYSRFAQSDGFIPYTADWNNYHVQLGINKSRSNRDFRAGIYLSYGSTCHHRQEVNFDKPSESNLLMGDPGYSKAWQFTAGVLLSYIQHL